MRQRDAGHQEESVMIHMFSYRINRGRLGCVTVALCGESKDGSVTQNRAKVTCTKCLAVYRGGEPPELE